MWRAKGALWCGGTLAGLETGGSSSPAHVSNFPLLGPGRWPDLEISMNAPQLTKNHLCCVSLSPSPPPPLLQVVSALESNPTARRTQLHHKFEQVIALVEDNIYECCSEAWKQPACFDFFFFFPRHVISFSCWQLPFSWQKLFGNDAHWSKSLS